MSLKVEVKPINQVWHAFFPDKVLTSVGINDIIDQVTEAWPPIEKGYELNWEARNGKFVVREVESKTSKISKSDQ